MVQPAVTVLDDIWTVEVRLRPVIERNSDTGDLVVHPIAEEPATVPPVMSLVVCSDKWADCHLIYWENVDLCEEESPEEDYDNQQYPLPTADITITAGDKGVVTVLDNVTKLHLGLFIHRDMIIRAEGPEKTPLNK